MARLRLIALILLAATLASAQWPVPKTGQEAYDYANARRNEARDLWKKKDAAGIDLLTKTLAYLDQPLVRYLSLGNRYLAARRLNIHLDLAQAYVLQGQTDKALDYLRKVIAEAPSPQIADYCDHESDFDVLRDNPEYRRILSGARAFQSFWESPALNTPYRENLEDAEKLAGLSKFWSEVKYNFGFPEKLVTLHWDQLYMDWIPRVLATRSTTDYYRELMLLCARLGDGHTNVYAPSQSNMSAKPPLRTGLVEGRVLILEVGSPALEAQGVRAGMEIAAVDGEPTLAYARREVEPYQSAATPQDRDVRTYWYGFLRGPNNKPVRLTLRDAAGKQSEVEVRRSGYSGGRTTPGFEWRLLSGNVAYVALNSFESDQILNQWRRAFPEISKASALILDVRSNGGGNSGIGDEILRDLVAAPFPGLRVRMRRYNPTERAGGLLMDFQDVPADQYSPHPNAYSSKPALVLAGPATFSAAEDFLVVWKNSGRGKIIGEPSAGSTGQPLSFGLPGGGTARVCTKKDMFPDGTEWVGKGIDPDILVRPALADVQAGKDTVLNRALEYLASVK